MGKYDDLTADLPPAVSQSGKMNSTAGGGRFDDLISDLAPIPQTTWEAVKSALGSRRELRPYGMGNESVFSGDPLNAARQTLEAPIRVGATINRAYGFPADVGKATGFPKTGEAISSALPFLVGPSTSVESSRILAPAASAGREAGVAAADELGIPLSRADVSGSPVTSGIESVLEKTPLGVKPIDALRAQQQAAKQAALQKVSSEMGTQEAPHTIGMKAKEGYASEMDQARNLRDTLYSQIPQDTYIPLKNSVNTADQIIQEQSQYLPTTRNGDVVALAKDIQNAERGISSGEGVTGGPEIKGITTEIPGRAITETKESSLLSPSGQPLTFQTQRNIPPKTDYGSYQSFSPEQQFSPKPNYPLLARLRSVLGDKIQQNTITQADGSSTLTQAGRDFVRLKASLDLDINEFANVDQTGFGGAYKYATSYAKDFAGAYQNPDIKRVLLTDPEKIVPSIFRPNNATEILRFRAGVGEGPFQLAKKQFTQQLLDSPNLGKALGKYQDILDTVYTPTEQGKLGQLSDAFDILQGAEKRAGNPSGTGRQMIGASEWTAAGYALKSGRPDIALSIIGLPYLASKAYVKTSRGINLPLSRATIGAASAGGNVLNSQ